MHFTKTLNYQHFYSIEVKVAEANILFITYVNCNCKPIFLTKCRIKSSLKFSILSEENEWKIPILKELVSVRLDKLNIPGFEMDEVSAIIRQLCCGN